MRCRFLSLTPFEAHHLIRYRLLLRDADILAVSGRGTGDAR